MGKEKNNKKHPNQDWLKEKYKFNSRYNVDPESKERNISKLYRNIGREYTDSVHLSKQFLEKFFK